MLKAVEMHVERRHIAAVFAIALVFCSGSTSAASYTFSELLPLEGATAGWRDLFAMNNKGQVVGRASNAYGHIVATTWIDGVPTELPRLAGGFSSDGYGINDSGRIVGASEVYGLGPAGYAVSVAVAWDAGQPTNLGFFGGYFPLSYAASINNSGQIAGAASYTGGGIHGVLWNGSSMRELGTLGGSSSAALSSNEVGQAVGWSHTYANATQHAVRWDNTNVVGWNMTDLGTLGGNNSFAQDINNQGLAVGRADDANGVTHAVMWTAGGKIVELDSSGTSFANAINSSGQISGATERGATIWVDGVEIDLNDYIDPSLKSGGWKLSRAADINDNGWILVEAINSDLQSYAPRCFVMTPSVPEPSAYVMLLTGLAGLGYAALRNKKAAH